MKTNVMRILDSLNIAYQVYGYSQSTAVSGQEVAGFLNLNPAQMFKTLVTISDTHQAYVFLVPVNKELDLKKAAQVCHEKRLNMLPQKELFPLTGYVHGGCSMIGMKKTFPTFIDSSAQNFSSIIFSAGKIGYNIAVERAFLPQVVTFQYADISKDK